MSSHFGIDMYCYILLSNFKMAKTVKTMLDENFCVFLEYTICEFYQIDETDNEMSPKISMN